MGDNVDDDRNGAKHVELFSVKTPLSSTEVIKSVPNASGVCNRQKYLTIGLFVSLLLNTIFMVLFVVVFIRLNDFNTRLSCYDNSLDEGKGRSLCIKGNKMLNETNHSPSKTRMDRNEVEVLKDISKLRENSLVMASICCCACKIKMSQIDTCVDLLIYYDKKVYICLLTCAVCLERTIFLQIFK